MHKLSTVGVILYRRNLTELSEEQAMRQHFIAKSLATLLPDANSDAVVQRYVVARYSALPFYEEYQEAVESLGYAPINDLSLHDYVARMDWALRTVDGVGALHDLTPETWTWERGPGDGQSWRDLNRYTPFVVKGRTNSRKFRWDTSMFARDRESVDFVARRLLDDTYIAEQGLVVRRYVPFRRLGDGLNGLPIVNEWRVFFLGSAVLCRGFYWKGTHPELESSATWSSDAEAVASEAALRISRWHWSQATEHRAQPFPFLAIDVAETEEGRWMVVEVNDGQQAGLCGCSAEELYRSLAQAMTMIPGVQHG